MAVSKEQIPLGLYLPRFYISHPHWGLNRKERLTYAHRIDLIVSTVYRHQFSTFVSSRNYVPGTRTGQEARLLWLALRAEMANSQFFLMMDGDRSAGSSQELRNAADLKRPTIFLQKEGVPRNELLTPTSLVCLAELEYSEFSDALTLLDSYLRSEAGSLYAMAATLVSPSELNDQYPIGATVAFIRRRLGWDRSTLARVAGLHEEEVKAIETDLFRFAPPINLLAMVASAFNIDLAKLFWSPQHWLLHEFELNILAAGQIDGPSFWTVPMMREFHASAWAQAATGLAVPPALDGTLDHMRQWRLQRNNGHFSAN